MAQFDFQVTMAIDGSAVRFPFVLAATTLSVAVGQAISTVKKQHPAAQFDGLTYFHPPL